MSQLALWVEIRTGVEMKDCRDNVVEMIAEDGCKERCRCIDNVHMI